MSKQTVLSRAVAVHGRVPIHKVLRKGARGVVHGIGFMWVSWARASGRTLGAQPKRPMPWYQLWLATRALGGRVSNEGVVNVYFEDSTTSAWQPPSEGWLNGRCTDIRKSTVAKAFASAGGQVLSVDPRMCHEVIVEKSEINGTHSGQLIMAPCMPRAGYVYERFVDTAVDDWVRDYRVVIVRGSIVCAWEIARPSVERFAGATERVSEVDVATVFSNDEHVLIVETARHLHMDVGDFDVLRDNVSGNIYIVDANKTSVMPPLALSFGERLSACTRIGNALFSVS